MDWENCILVGSQLSPSQVDELEIALIRDPICLSARAKLLSYYWSHERENGMREKHHEHALWIIQNHPEHDLAACVPIEIAPEANSDWFERAKESWLGHLDNDSRNLKVLANAASFFGESDFELALSLYERGKRLEPGNVFWNERLALILHLRSHGMPNEFANRALEEQNQAYELSAGQAKFVALVPLPEYAVNAGQLALAASYSHSLLDCSVKHRDNPLFGSAVHEANITVALHAIVAGDMSKAVTYLERSYADTCPPVNFLNANTRMLLQRLLSAGETGAVLKYLRYCQKRHTDRRIVTWIHSIESGITPQIARHLV
ncbi:MAG TPA: hypothetical protein V6C81_31625 [Planktothrix sp.]|jgi:hypothetical protein